MKKKIKLICDFTDKEKEELEITMELFNTNYQNQRINITHLVKHLYIICFILVVTLIIF